MLYNDLILSVLEKWYSIKLEDLTELQLKQLDAALFPFIPKEKHHGTILNKGQADEVVYLLNNPDEMNSRFKEAAKKYHHEAS